jgi:hypothetical protein
MRHPYWNPQRGAKPSQGLPLCSSWRTPKCHLAEHKKQSNKGVMMHMILHNFTRWKPPQFQLTITPTE